MFPGETVLSQKALGMEADPHTSDFRVMSSGGGWYVGTVYISCGKTTCKECMEFSSDGTAPKEGRELEPNSRETDYFDTREEAEEALEEYIRSGELSGQRY